MKDNASPRFAAILNAALGPMPAARITRDIAFDQGSCKLTGKIAPLMFWLRQCCVLFVFALPLLVAGLATAVDQPATPQPLATVPAEPLYHESLRPQFHFTARYWDGYTIEPGADAAITGVGGQEGWINDVNGPIYCSLQQDDLCQPLRQDRLLALDEFPHATGFAARTIAIYRQVPKRGEDRRM
jgi:hypothetical protein